MPENYIPSVVIVGRPNVGKSTLFNIIAKQLISIVEATPGVTRDRVVRTVTWGGKTFDLIDTGGIGVVDEESLAAGVERQIDTAIDVADVVLFMVDVQTGLHEVETKIAARLHKQEKEVFLIANKADSKAKSEKSYEFLNLGFSDPLLISAKGRRGLGELENAVSQLVDNTEVPVVDPTIPKVAIIGRRNVGKSSLVNALAQEERVIVSSIPGTTRDSIDVNIKRKDKEYLLIDTAGLMKRKQRNGIDFYGSVRTERSINRSDGVILMIDAKEGIGRVDKQMADDILRKYKPCVIAINKWDLASDQELRTGEYTKYIERELPGMHFVPVVYLSVHEHNHTWAPLKVMEGLIEQAHVEMQTAKLNACIQNAYKKRRPQRKGGRAPKIFYAVQIQTAPPTVKLFVNDVKLIKKVYRRYLANEIRKHTAINEIPIKFSFTSKEYDPDGKRIKQAPKKKTEQSGPRKTSRKAQKDTPKRVLKHASKNKQNKQNKKKKRKR